MTPSSETLALGLAVAGIMALVVVRFPANLLSILGVPRLSPSEQGLLAAATAMAVIGLALLEAGDGPLLVASRAILAGAVVGIMFYDWRYLIIPDVLSAMVVLAAILAAGPKGQVMSGLVGAVICAGLLALVARAWKSIRGIEGLGFGDVKLAGALGLLLGAQIGLWAIAAASISASLWSLWRLRKGTPDEPLKIPLGAFLGLSGLLFSVVVSP